MTPHHLVVDSGDQEEAEVTDKSTVMGTNNAKEVVANTDYSIFPHTLALRDSFFDSCRLPRPFTMDKFVLFADWVSSMRINNITVVIVVAYISKFALPYPKCTEIGREG